MALVLDELFRKKLTLAIVAAQEACEYRDQLERLYKEFAGVNQPQLLIYITEFSLGP